MAVAWLTTIGPAVEQVEYRLAESAGCGHHPALEHGQDARVDHRVDYRMDETNRLTWFGGGLAEVGLPARTPLAGEIDKAAARALMDGVDPRTGEVLVTPKRAAHPASKLAAAPLWAALAKAAAESGVDVAGLARTKWAAARLARLGRMVARDGEAHRIPVRDAERLVAEIDAPVRLEDVYAAGELQVARAHRGETVRIGDRGFDLTIDLPKSASVVWALGDEATAAELQDAFRESVLETLQDLESWCAYGMRGEHGNGKTARRIESSGFLGWVMWHDEARPVRGQDPDPHMHAHAVIAHMVRGVDGQWSTPGNGGRELHRHVETAGALAQARFRARTTALGYRWERRDDGRVWELAGVPPRVRELFSKRQGQTFAALRELGLDPQTASSAHGKAAAALTREGKHTAASSAEAPPGSPAPAGDLRRSWRDQVRGEGLDAAAIVAAARGDGPDGPDGGPRRDGPDGPTPPPPAPSPREVAERLFRDGDGLTAHGKVVTRPRLLAAVLDELPAGTLDVAEAEALADAVVALQDGPVVPLPAAGGRERGPAYQTHPERYTSRDVVDAERTVLAIAERGRDAGRAVVGVDAAAMAVSTFEASRGFGLSPEQRAVVERLTGAGHAVDAVVGVAGAGKTTLMAAARSAWTAAGYRVRGATTAAVAAQELTASAGIASQTIASLLGDIADPERPGLDGTDVLVVDEAAMVDDRELARLLTAAETAGTKTVLIGDPLQLRAIGVGGTFAAVHQAVDGLELTENRRQRDDVERRALQLWRDGDRDAALREWAAAGRVHAGDGREDTLAALLHHWAATRVDTPFTSVHDELKELLILAGSNADVDALNLGARAIRREAGEITGPDRLYRLAGGGTLALAIGDHVRVRRNDYRTRRPDASPEDVDVLNGYRGVVIGFDGRDLVVQWRRPGPDGPVLEDTAIPAARVARGELTHGTAMTVAAAQGQSAERVLVYGMGLDPHALYPAMSRDSARVDLYLPRALLESDADRARHGEPAGAANELTRVITAYAATLRGDRADKLITPELGDEIPRPRPERQERQERQDARIAPWHQRPYGARTDNELAKLRAAAERELTICRRVEELHAAELARADRGEGPAAAMLAARRDVLAAAADAAERLERLQEWTRDAYQRRHALARQVRDAQAQAARNPVALRLTGTSRAAARAAADALAAQEADLAQQITEAETQQTRLRAAAAAPYRYDVLEQARLPVDHRPGRWSQRGPAAELAALTARWDEHQAAAIAADRAGARHRAEAAAHTERHGPVPMEVARIGRPTRTRDAAHAADILTAVNGEITARTLLPAARARAEATARDQYRAQQAAEQRAARRADIEARAHELHRRPGPRRDGPGRGLSR
ncbi:MobF family relaxase [Actinomadura sp. WAC 06369]|uniref:MobF family relaxase n=1 Tax=Actinomadura sp. WAC 06369 TaxID=2203193 RepID=UPI000F79F457|nr:MobF family relaxase [Actinomadura sp. WAC 06369]RSN53323.1 hypothetical protein DMH08_27725 [Actinomadura sp. WAC 06369]